jgi:hypothetical protein
MEATIISGAPGSVDNCQLKRLAFPLFLARHQGLVDDVWLSSDHQYPTK